MRQALQILTCFCLMSFLVAMPGAWLSAHAEEGETAKSEDGGGKNKSAKDEGGEGGEKKKKGDEDISGGRFAGDPIYVHIAPMILPIISNQGAEQLVTVIIDVEVKDFDAADKMHTDMPKVRDALMRALYGGLGQGSLRNGKLVDVAKVKEKASAALREVMGDGVKQVLVQGVSQRIL